MVVATVPTVPMVNTACVRCLGMTWNDTSKCTRWVKPTFDKLLKGKVLTRVTVCHVAAPNTGHCSLPTLRRKMALFRRLIKKKEKRKKKTSRTKAVVQNFLPVSQRHKPKFGFAIPLHERSLYTGSLDWRAIA